MKDTAFQASFTPYGQQPYSDMITMEVDRAKQQLKAELPALIIEHIGEAARADRELRMQCVSMAVGRMSPDVAVINPITFADELAQYVLTGKKPGEA